MPVCPGCEYDIDYEEVDFPFGDDVQCPKCKQWWETECEYGWDGMTWWFTGKPGEAQEEPE